MKKNSGVWGVMVAVLALQGCAGYWAERKAGRLLAEGKTGESVAVLMAQAQRNPANYRLKYLQARDAATRDLLLKAQQARQQGKTDEALALYQDILRYDSQHMDARRGLELIARDRRHAEAMTEAKALSGEGSQARVLDILNSILVENPAHMEAGAWRQRIEQERNRESLTDPVLKESLRKPVSLEFRGASIQAIFEVLSRSSGINFIFDKDVNPELKTTIYARNTSVEDALGLILRTSQLSRKVLNDSTLLIYPSTGEKEKQYEDLVVRTFYLGSVKPGKMQDMIRTLIAPKSMYVDDGLGMLVVRDTLNVIDTVERLIAAYDIAEPEVTLEVEILEVSNDSLLNVGIQYPDQLRASVFGAVGKPGELTVDEIKSLDKNSFKLFVPDPFAVLNFRQTSGKANTLANPRIRVRSREKAKVLIGDKVPVITTTTNQTSGSTSESVSYLDVGLKLEVEPEVHVNNDVSINVGLEVSNIVKEVKSTTGLLTYQIGTRTANTVLRLRDGETQMLAGLIRDEKRDSASHLPGLGKIPLLGRLFSNETNNASKSEIVLLITPHVVRSLATPAAHVVAFSSGTGERVSTQPVRLGKAGKYSVSDKKLLNQAVKAAALSGTAAVPAPVPPAREAELPVPVDEAPEMESLVDPALASLRLDMVAPAQIPLNKEFTVALMLNGGGFEALGFDLVFDQPGVELLQANALGAVEGFEVTQAAQSLKITAGRSQGVSGPLAMITLKATQMSEKPMTLRIERSDAKAKNDVVLLVAAPAPRQMTITP